VEWVEEEGRRSGLERTCQGLTPLFDHTCYVCAGRGGVDGERGTDS